MKIFWFQVIVFISLIGVASEITSAQQAKRSFTVADDIGLTLFGTPSGGRPDVHFSPDGNYLAVWAERGRVDMDCVEDSLLFYSSQDIEDFLKHPDASHPPATVWIVNRSGKEGPIINNWRWLGDSSGVAFLERAGGGDQHLMLADLRRTVIERLTRNDKAVNDFDVRDRQNYVYTAPDQAERKKLQEKAQDERLKSALVGTGHPLYELLFPDDPRVHRSSSPTHLWAVLDGRHFEVRQNGAPIIPAGGLALSPDGGSLVTMLPVPEVPSSWEMLYPPPLLSWPVSDRQHYMIHSGHQDLQSDGISVHQYVQINLRTGAITTLTDAPISNDAGWWASGSPSWSNDGREVLLPGTFIKSTEGMPSRPCVAVVDLSLKLRSCVEALKGHAEEDFHVIQDARFAARNKQQVLVSFRNHEDGSIVTTQYRQIADGAWQVVGRLKGGADITPDGLEVRLKQGFDHPPLLVATDPRTSRVILDPNPQLEDIELGEASVYTWKDKEGRQWRGGLYKPTDYNPEQRYPLVIQTHGFDESEFRPSGVFPTAFAARELAARGIMVLQTWAGVDGANCPIVTPEEGACSVAVFESAARQLVSEAMVDPEKIGIIGFSRTCYYVMELLTSGSSLHITAASVTDGVMLDYFQYMQQPEDLSTEVNPMIGAPPFGEGLQKWLKRSPGFNLDKIATPLLVVGEGPISLLTMWQPYAGLRYLKKPVDLIMLNTDEHVLTNPAVRIASQGGTVDWFCFWLQDYEDPDPTKKEQYERWRGLKKIQEHNENQSAAATN